MRVNGPDNTIYSALSRHDNTAVSGIAQDFHDSARQIKKRFSSYVRRWCNPAVGEHEHDELVQESREIFQLIMERVKYENEKMFLSATEKLNGLGQSNLLAGTRPAKHSATQVINLVETLLLQKHTDLSRTGPTAANKY